MKKLKIEYGDSVFALPREKLLEALSLSQANGFNLKVLLLAASDDALRADYDAGRAALCARLDCTQSALDRALSFWSEAGVMSIAEAPGQSAQPPTEAQPISEPAEKKEKKLLLASKLPTYTESEAADIMENTTELASIIDMCQQIVGKMFTPAEAQIVVGLYDHLGLDGEYIATLFAYCKDNGKRSLRYIEKTALSLFDEGVDNTAALTAYIKRREDREDNLARIRKLIGAGAREFTSKEKKAFENWLDQWNFDIEVITRAYEVTVDKINEPSVPYMNRVLENWHNAGLTTIEAVEASLEAYKKNKAEAESNRSGFETDEFFEAALARSQKYLEG